MSAKLIKTLNGNNTYTFPSNGYVICSSTVYIDGVLISTDHDNKYIVELPVRKGQQLSTSIGIFEITFIPSL